MIYIFLFSNSGKCAGWMWTKSLKKYTSGATNSLTELTCTNSLLKIFRVLTSWKLLLHFLFLTVLRSPVPVKAGATATRHSTAGLQRAVSNGLYPLQE